MKVLWILSLALVQILLIKRDVVYPLESMQTVLIVCLSFPLSTGRLAGSADGLARGLMSPGLLEYELAGGSLQQYQ